jgi:uncharacterized repeat protein (TIGR03847 family)
VSRQIFDFPEPERFVAGTVGMPGERTFFLQARYGNNVVSVVLEKLQVAALADRIEQILSVVEGTNIGFVRNIDDKPLELPIFEEFRVGTMALGWDDETHKVFIEAYAVSDAELPDMDADYDNEDNVSVDTLRVRLTPDQARSFIQRARTLVESGRPACPFCGQPLDPSGHICPRANGFKRRL